ncbi:MULTISPECIES: hypothetical protein [Vagococcus]|uniref:hypothetical protein n=1 Tax=Vagococcus TaxID=2737 RepID=UPI002FC58794
MSKKKIKTKRKIKKKKRFIDKIKDISSWNKIAVISTFIVILIAIASASTYAWFTTSDSKENQFKSNFKYEVVLVDKFATPETFEFGNPYPKAVSVKNTGDIPAFARLLVFPEFKKGDEILPIDESLGIKYNISANSDWLLGEDGFYYYTKIIKPGEESPVLFDEVTVDSLSDEAKELYSGAEFSIDVKLESVDFRDNEYRFSWWGNRDNAPTEKNLKLVDDKLQKEKR